PLYEKIAAAFRQASRELNIPVEWGGDWKTLKDGPHFQLPHGAYPA
ncbi:M15 family peptidase, partial [Escherichia coli]|nr:M15 family metallopeptidase [Escherichia coli]EFN9561749.1 M15 family peptidase [Escherichia coli]EHL1245751.1 M15 family metallopeptidase [Escherichia coli]HBA7811058.1 M15 family metallopeptidase [Escherichia coli]